MRSFWIASESKRGTDSLIYLPVRVLVAAVSALFLHGGFGILLGGFLARHVCGGSFVGGGNDGVLTKY